MPDPSFLEMMMNIKTEWYVLAKERGMKNIASKIVVDDELLYG